MNRQPWVMVQLRISYSIGKVNWLQPVLARDLPLVTLTARQCKWLVTYAPSPMLVQNIKLRKRVCQTVQKQFEPQTDSDVWRLTLKTNELEHDSEIIACSRLHYDARLRITGMNCGLSSSLSQLQMSALHGFVLCKVVPWPVMLPLDIQKCHCIRYMILVSKSSCLLRSRLHVYHVWNPSSW